MVPEELARLAGDDIVELVRVLLRLTPSLWRRGGIAYSGGECKSQEISPSISKQLRTGRKTQSVVKELCGGEGHHGQAPCGSVPALTLKSDT